MVKHVFRGAYVLAALLMCAASLNADASVNDDNLVVFYVHVRG